MFFQLNTRLYKNIMTEAFLAFYDTHHADIDSHFCTKQIRDDAVFHNLKQLLEEKLHENLESLQICMKELFDYGKENKKKEFPLMSYVNMSIMCVLANLHMNGHYTRKQCEDVYTNCAAYIKCPLWSAFDSYIQALYMENQNQE